ncbi:Mss4-like protein [Bombardia bombarda]|uniref:Mss4-like protein n=1 Tax=Bombardia bombarda TaxID=252184 RepID=A0AA39U494_9PEZI|nr:Mss4-like protein [Bombardia bombarda]
MSLASYSSKGNTGYSAVVISAIGLSAHVYGRTSKLLVSLIRDDIRRTNIYNRLLGPPLNHPASLLPKDAHTSGTHVTVPTTRYPTPFNPTRRGLDAKMNVACQCSDVSFRTVTPEPLAIYHCHCTDCRKATASAFGTSAIFPASDLLSLPPELMQSKLKCWTRPTDSGGSMDCYFCRECGVRVLHQIRNPDGTARPVFVIRGGLIEGLDYSKAKHIFTRSAVVPIPEGAEQYEGRPPTMLGRPGNLDVVTGTQR